MLDDPKTELSEQMDGWEVGGSYPCYKMCSWEGKRRR